MIKNLVMKSRSVRRFREGETILIETLRDLIELARCSPSAANLQPLKYILSVDKQTNEKIFPTTIWAGYLTDWDGPAPGERPSAYIVVLGDTTITKNFGCDHGIAAQSILLGAAEKNIAGCMIGSIHRDQLRTELNIPERFEILLILALGAPAETILLENAQNGAIKYYRDKDNTHHVPKRPLDEIIVSF